MNKLNMFADDPKKVEHLLSLEGAKERLYLFPANLLEEGSFDAAVQDCLGVFHTASPLFFDFKDPQVPIVYSLSPLLHFLAFCYLFTTFNCPNMVGGSHFNAFYRI